MEHPALDGGSVSELTHRAVQTLPEEARRVPESRRAPVPQRTTLRIRTRPSRGHASSFHASADGVLRGPHLRRNLRGCAANVSKAHHLENGSCGEIRVGTACV